jgi:cell division protein FtsZ
MGGSGAVRRPVAPSRAKLPISRPSDAGAPVVATTVGTSSPASTPMTAAHVPANVPATSATTHAAAVHAAKAEQNEFSFGEIESRGYFDKTDRNLFEGQDLDVPTYLRKGIKITL